MRIEFTSGNDLHLEGPASLLVVAQIGTDENGVTSIAFPSDLKLFEPEQPESGSSDGGCGCGSSKHNAPDTEPSYWDGYDDYSAKLPSAYHFEKFPTKEFLAYIIKVGEGDNPHVSRTFHTFAEAHAWCTSLLDAAKNGFFNTSNFYGVKVGAPDRRHDYYFSHI